MTRNWPRVLSCLLASISGCLLPESAYEPYWSSDVDGDGVPSSEDCDPKDGDVYAGAWEICGDGVVQNCDPSAGWPPEECVWSGERALAEDGIAWTGEDAGDQAGYAVAGVGDVTGDGREDLLISAMQPFLDEVEGGGTRELVGRAYLVSGEIAMQGGELREATTRWVGRSGADAVGGALCALGDSNGDELPEIAIGAPYYGSDDLNPDAAGAVYLVPSDDRIFEDGDLDSEEQVDAARWVGELAGGRAGQALAGFVDELESTQAPFLVIGAPFASPTEDNQGRVYLMRGEDAVRGNGTLTCDPWCLEGEADDLLGFAVDAADLDGDGVHDLLSGALYSDLASPDAGALYIIQDVSLVSSPAEPITWAGVDAGERAGCIVAQAGDLNGDGGDEVVVGAIGTDPPEARFYVLSGTTILSGNGSLAAADATWSQESADEVDALTAASAGDVDGDDRGDLVLGAPYDDGSGPTSATYLISGPRAMEGGALLHATAYWVGAVTGDQAGFAVAGVGDLDNDGLADLLVGAPGSGSGSAWLLISPGL